MTITFEEICKLEPGIRELYRLARMTGRPRGRRFDSDAIWYTFFKPVVVHLIGFGRRPSAPMRFIKACDLAADHFSARPTIPIECSTSDDPRLKTSEAYSLVYETISGALPD